MSYGEVQYFFQAHSPDSTTPLTVAMVSQLTPKYNELQSISQNTLIMAAYEGDATLKIIPVTSIVAVIAAVPAPTFINPLQVSNLYYIVERIGFDVSHWNPEDVLRSSCNTVIM